MKKTAIFLVLFTVILMGTGHDAKAFTFLDDWGLNADGNGIETVGDWIDTTGITYVENTFTSDTSFIFTENATFLTVTHDNSNLWDFIGSGEITAMFTASGTGTLNGDLSFESGILNIYYDDTPDYGTTASDFYGATDGVLLASFSVLTGYAVLDGQAVPNGAITIILESTYLRTSTWYDELGNDLSLTDPIKWVLGFSTTNANLLEEAPDENAIAAFDATSETVLMSNLWLSNNGQYRLAVVPEPSTFLLLGGGLVGLGLIAYRRKQ